MPQESLRSVVYRSFVSCDDPKGVIECKTFRKAKTSSHKKDHKRHSSASSSSSSHKEEKNKMISKGKIEEEFYNPSSFQLLEVSKGAQKLNQVTDSWSKGGNFNGQTKEIAKDLLRGALDLQESLVMLGKIQEASQYMVQLKKKHKQKIEKERVDELGSERTDSSRARIQNCQTGFQMPRLSADGSSRNCVEELKVVIRESLVRQNLLPNTEERSHFDRRKMESFSDIPSTSSSNKFSYTDDCSCSSTEPQSKVGSNLIAKLMGLEEIPPEDVQNEKISDPQLPFSDIYMPKSRKPQYADQTADTDRKSFEDILETMRFKGLLGSDSSKEVDTPTSLHSHAYHSNRKSFDDRAPPIVIIKPLHFPLEDDVWEERDVTYDEKLRKQEFEEFSVNSFIKDKFKEYEEERVLNFNGKWKKQELEVFSTKRTVKEKAKENKEERDLNNHQKWRKKELEDISMRRAIREKKDLKQGRDLNYNVRLRKQELEAISITKAVNEKVESREQIDLNSNEKHREEEVVEEISVKMVNKEKVECKDEVKKREKPSENNKLKRPVGANGKPQRKESVGKKEKVVPNKREPLEKESLKSKTVSISHEKAKVKKHESRSNAENQTFRKQITTSNPILEKKTRNVSQDANLQKKIHIKKEKAAGKSPTANLVTQNSECKDDDKRIDLTRTDTMSVHKIAAEEGTNASKIHVGHLCSNNQHDGGSKLESSAEAFNILHLKTEDSKSFNIRTNLKSFLLSSPSFLSQADGLFGLNITRPITLQANITDNLEATNARLYLDCSNELMERNSIRYSLVNFHPFPQTPKSNSRICFSLEKLVDEVCDGVENLISFGEVVGGNCFKDSVYLLVGKDLKCIESVGGTWDLGWRGSFSIDDVENVAGELEKLVLYSLVEELIMDFLF